jgi:isoleucyl-tRNA synthetase
MPYAQQHWPFSVSDEEFKDMFPADFIAEGLDQTRGWFYTLLIISTALFDTCPAKNVIVNGLILAEDGKKMSKSLKNYPDPTLVLDSAGADSLRLYLVNSPAVRAEPLAFSLQGVRAVTRDVFLPWHNAYRFFVQQALAHDFAPADRAIAGPGANIMDRWILAELQQLVEHVRTEMEAYRLYAVLPRLVQFIDALTNWYVRLNRMRLREGVPEALETLFTVLIELARLMAPFTPFITESMWLNLRALLPNAEAEENMSVHFQQIPSVRPDFVDPAVLGPVRALRQAIELGRQARSRCVAIGSQRLPVRRATVVHLDAELCGQLEGLKEYLASELNADEVVFVSDERGLGDVKLQADQKALGQRLKKAAKPVLKALGTLSHDDALVLLRTGRLEVAGETVSREEVNVALVTLPPAAQAAKHVFVCTDGAMMVAMDTEISEDARQRKLVRDFVSCVQALRKTGNLVIADEIEVHVAGLEAEAAAELRSALSGHADVVLAGLKGRPFVAGQPADAVATDDALFATYGVAVAITRL